MLIGREQEMTCFMNKTKTKIMLKLKEKRH